MRTSKTSLAVPCEYRQFPVRPAVLIGKTGAQTDNRRRFYWQLHSNRLPTHPLLAVGLCPKNSNRASGFIHSQRYPDILTLGRPIFAAKEK